MGIFKRLFKVGQAEAHSIVDKLEDPIKMTDQGIRDLKVSLDESLKALAEVKALAIRSRNSAQQARTAAEDYERKAMMLVQRAQSGQMDPAEADRLAGEALMRKEEQMRTATMEETNVKSLDQKIATLDANIKRLKSNISKFENEARVLKARSKVSKATSNVNKQLANIDSSSTVAMLERMKEKVDQQEALSDAYADIANENRSIDEEINSALDNNQLAASDALAQLKAKMGVLPQNTPGDIPPA